MKQKYFTIQLIPENSEKLRTFRIPAWLLKVLKIFCVILSLILIVFIIKIVDISNNLLQFKKIKNENTELLAKQAEYEEYFSTLDSIFIIDYKIQNILGLFLESDSAKVHKILEKHQLIAKINSKNDIDFDGINGWRPISEKIKAEQIPDVIPVSGIMSKGYSDKDKHFGID